jgi:DNA-binding transcriptional MerR regulator
MSEAEEVVVGPFTEPGEAARRLGVSPSGLRRLSDAYEQVHGPLNRRGGTGARLFTEEALERLAQARTLVEGRRYKSVVEALTALARGLEPDLPAEMTGHRPTALDAATGEALGVLLGELRGLRAEVERLRVVVEDKSPPQLPSDNLRPAAEHGPLVRVALWLERRLQGQG